MLHNTGFLWGGKFWESFEEKKAGRVVSISSIDLRASPSRWLCEHYIWDKLIHLT